MRLLQIALCAAVLAWAWQQTRTLPARDAILPELLEEPRQGSTNPEQGRRHDVRPGRHVQQPPRHR